MKRYLILEDGTVYTGEAFGADRSLVGELVFTTGMTGYQEAITDDSYAGQILMFTNPLLGNYGVSMTDEESLVPGCVGVVCRQIARVVDNWSASDTLPHFLEKKGIPGISGVDTRQLTEKIRQRGTMHAVLVDSLPTPHEVSRLINSDQGLSIDPAVFTKSPYRIPGTGFNTVVVDFGAKESILRELIKRNCNIVIVPGDYTAEQIMDYHPAGVLLSNGPGDPTDRPQAIEMIRELQGKTVLFGICLGHQLFALANGAKTYKMKFGHRGFNHPVKEIATGQVMFTSQNHGYAVDASSIDHRLLTETHVEINDQTVEGLRHKKYPAASVQFHPDAAPGPHDAADIFDDFIAMVRREQEEKIAQKK